MFALAMLAATLTMAARQEKTAEKPAAVPPARPGVAEMERLKFIWANGTTPRRIQTEQRTPVSTPASWGRAEIR